VITHASTLDYWWNSTEENPEDVSEDVVLMELNSDFSTKGMSSDDHFCRCGLAGWGDQSRDMFDLFRG
jgi:hypothetical protein